jgi:hypothetical protein
MATIHSNQIVANTSAGAYGRSITLSWLQDITFNPSHPQFQPNHFEHVLNTDTISLEGYSGLSIEHCSRQSELSIYMSNIFIVQTIMSEYILESHQNPMHILVPVNPRLRL